LSGGVWGFECLPTGRRKKAALVVGELARSKETNFGFPGSSEKKIDGKKLEEVCNRPPTVRKTGVRVQSETPPINRGAGLYFAKHKPGGTEKRRVSTVSESKGGS